MGKYYTVNPKRDKRGLTAKQKRFAELALEIGKKEAAKEVWPDQIRPEKTASRELGKEQVSSYMSEILDQKGATREYCGENIVAKMRSRNDKASLEATKMALEIHGELKKDKTILPVPVTKEQYQRLCMEFWQSRPNGKE